MGYLSYALWEWWAISVILFENDEFSLKLSNISPVGRHGSKALCFSEVTFLRPGAACNPPGDRSHKFHHTTATQDQARWSWSRPEPGESYLVLPVGVTAVWLLWWEAAPPERRSLAPLPPPSISYPPGGMCCGFANHSTQKEEKCVPVVSGETLPSQFQQVLGMFQQASNCTRRTK